ncbi:hypothetical protein ACTXT7_011683 [Hymenolepis weldensis]
MSKEFLIARGTASRLRNNNPAIAINLPELARLVYDVLEKPSTSSPTLLIENAPNNLRLLVVIPNLYKKQHCSPEQAPAIHKRRAKRKKNTQKNLKWQILQKYLNPKRSFDIYNKIYQATPAPRYYAAIIRPTNSGSLKRSSNVNTFKTTLPTKQILPHLYSFSEVLSQPPHPNITTLPLFSMQ